MVNYNACQDLNPLNKNIHIIIINVENYIYCVGKKCIAFRKVHITRHKASCKI